MTVSGELRISGPRVARIETPDKKRPCWVNVKLIEVYSRKIVESWGESRHVPTPRTNRVGAEETVCKVCGNFLHRGP